MFDEYVDDYREIAQSLQDMLEKLLSQIMEVIPRPK